MDNEAFEQFMDFDFQKLSSFLISLSSYDISIIASLLGVLISTPLSILEQNAVGNFLQLIGQTMETVSALRAALEPDISLQDFAQMRREFDQLKVEVERLRGSR